MVSVSVVVFVKRSGLDGDVYLWLGVECRGVFLYVYFWVFRYIRRLWFVFSNLSVSARLEQGSDY
jgi:hypothetical protein